MHTYTHTYKEREKVKSTEIQSMMGSGVFVRQNVDFAQSGPIEKRQTHQPVKSTFWHTKT